MTHPRQQIRTAIRDALVGKTNSGAKVYRSRTSLHRARDLPLTSVYTLNEVLVEDSLKTSPRRYTRLLSVMVGSIVSGRTDDTVAGAGEDDDDVLDDRMDALAEQIEAAVLLDETFGGLVGDCWLSSTEMSFEQDAERTIGMLAMTFTVRYETEVPIVSDALDDFETADIRTSLNGEQAEADQSHDVVTLPTD